MAKRRREILHDRDGKHTLDNIGLSFLDYAFSGLVLRFPQEKIIVISR